MVAEGGVAGAAEAEGAGVADGEVVEAVAEVDTDARLAATATAAVPVLLRMPRRRLLAKAKTLRRHLH